MNNSVYGKAMENVRKRVDIQLIHDVKKARKMVAAPSFHAFKKFTDDLVGVERVKQCVMLNKPIYIGFTILELSKLHMYKFHYGYIQQKYGGNAKLLFTDTDSLTYEIETEDIYQDMLQDKHIFDTSDYPSTHTLHDQTNKKKIGCFKDELNGEIIREFVGLRPKMYSILTEKNQEKKTAKGVTRSVIKKKISHEDYKNCLFQSIESREVQHRIQSENHKMHTMKINKVALSPFDDKRYIEDDGIHTLALGHERTMSKLDICLKVMDEIDCD